MSASTGEITLGMDCRPNPPNELKVRPELIGARWETKLGDMFICTNLILAGGRTFQVVESMAEIDALIDAMKSAEASQ